MKRLTRALMLLCVPLLPLVSVGVTTAHSQLEERTAGRSYTSEKPQSLLRILSIIRDTFDLPISRETPPLPERGPDGQENLLPPFEIQEGETLGSAIARLEEASDHRWMFDVIGDIPVVRLNPDVVHQRTALDTVVGLHVEEASMWDSLCALARAINRKRTGDEESGKPLQIWPSGPERFKSPAPIIMQDSVVTLDLENVPARDALCAILASTPGTFAYFYKRYPELDHILIIAYSDTGSSVHGGNMPPDKELIEYWTLEHIGKLQSQRNSSTN